MACHQLYDKPLSKPMIALLEVGKWGTTHEKIKTNLTNSYHISQQYPSHLELSFRRLWEGTMMKITTFSHNVSHYFSQTNYNEIIKGQEWHHPLIPALSDHKGFDTCCTESKPDKFLLTRLEFESHFIYMQQYESSPETAPQSRPQGLLR